MPGSASTVCARWRAARSSAASCTSAPGRCWNSSFSRSPTASSKARPSSVIAMAQRARQCRDVEAELMPLKGKRPSASDDRTCESGHNRRFAAPDLWCSRTILANVTSVRRASPHAAAAGPTEPTNRGECPLNRQRHGPGCETSNVPIKACRTTLLTAGFAVLVFLCPRHPGHQAGTARRSFRKPC